MFKGAALRRFTRRGVIGGAIVTACLAGLAVAPAQAITDMSVTLRMSTTTDAYGNPRVAAIYTADLPTDSGWGYLYNGGSITVNCYGDDGSTRSLLFSTVHTMNTAQNLWADDANIHLSGFKDAPKGGLFNEDLDGTDEIYCTLTWRDGDGGTISRKTLERTGDF
ncbi:hypothetical protein [Kribbella sp. NPDC004536]|uniref:hypothetical protein n=1 Tax=Kribbella sp. NPDC004536 TaxID=3364106 RepID=UPI0036BD991D